MTDRGLSSARRRALFIVGALAAIVVLGFLTDRLHGEIDLTAGHSLSLSKETKDVLGHVHREVQALHTVPEGYQPPWCNANPCWPLPWAGCVESRRPVPDERPR